MGINCRINWYIGVGDEIVGGDGVATASREKDCLDLLEVEFSNKLLSSEIDTHLEVFFGFFKNLSTQDWEYAPESIRSYFTSEVGK